MGAPCRTFDEPHTECKNWPSCTIWEKEEFSLALSFISQECVTAYTPVSTRWFLWASQANLQGLRYAVSKAVRLYLWKHEYSLLQTRAKGMVRKYQIWLYIPKGISYHSPFLRSTIIILVFKISIPFWSFNSIMKLNTLTQMDLNLFIWFCVYVYMCV